MFDRCLEDEGYRVRLQSEGIIEGQVKEWDRNVSGPKRLHVPAEAEREHWTSTCNLKQTTAGGADCGHHQASRCPNSERMVSGAFSSTLKQCFSSTTDFPAARGKIAVVGKIVDLFMLVIKKDAKGRKKNNFVSRSSDRKTRTLTLMNLKQRRARMRFSALTHGAPARIPVFAPQHSFSFRQFDTYLQPIDF